MKERIILNLIYFAFSFIITFMLYVLFINRKRKSYNSKKSLKEIDFLVNRFNLDTNIIKFNTLKWIVTITNSLIISVTFVIVANIESFAVGLLVGFVIMLMLVYACYEIIGRFLKKRGEKNV